MTSADSSMRRTTRYGRVGWVGTTFASRYSRASSATNCSANQWISATFISVELTDIIASLAGLAAAVIMLRFWQPSGGAAARERLLDERAAEEADLGDSLDLEGVTGGHAGHDPPAASTAVASRPATQTESIGARRTVQALFPYLLIIAVFSVAKLLPAAKEFLASTDVLIKWPGLDGNILTAAGKVSANTSGGVVGKMISPQNLTIAATAVGLLGRESDIFRKVIWWSLGLLTAMCLLVGLQSSVQSWMVP
jgi:L-lactate permease